MRRRHAPHSSHDAFPGRWLTLPDDATVTPLPGQAENPSRQADAARVVLGRIVGVFGTRGWLKIYSYTRPRDNIFDFGVWEIDSPNGWVALTVTGHRRQGNGLVALLDRVTDRDAAMLYLNCDIAVARAALPVGEPGEYYWADLIGLSVFNQDGVNFGKVSRLLDTGAHDVLVVSGERQRLIPFVQGVYIQGVEPEQQRIRVDWHVDD